MGLRRFKMAKEKADKAKPLEKELIFVGVPSVDDHIHVAIQQFIATLDRLSASPDCPWLFQWGIEIGKRPVEFARNTLVKRFFETKASRLWMIDADMIPTNETFVLLQVDADVVVPRMFALKRDDQTRAPRLEICAYKYNVNGDNRFNHIIPKLGCGIVDVEGAGTGCMIIRRAVIEDERMHYASDFKWYGDKTLEDDDPPAVFKTHYAPNGRILRGEDVDFSLRAHDLGYKVQAHMGVGVGHAKLINLDDAATIANAACENIVRKMKGAENENQGQMEGSKGRPAAL